MSYKEELQSLGDAYFNEVYKGKHGQSDKEYADSRSDGGKMISGDSKMSGAEFTHGRRVKADNPGMQPDVGGKTKPKSQGKMDKGTRNDLMYRKANLKKEELEIYSSLGDAYASMYEGLKQAKKNVGADSCWDGYKAKGTKMKGGKSVPNCVKEEEEYSVSVEDGIALEEGKKECKDGYYYCKDEKKCKKKKKKKSSNTTIIVGRGYGGHHHHDHDDDKEDGNEGGGDTGGGDGGGGGE